MKVGLYQCHKEVVWREWELNEWSEEAEENFQIYVISPSAVLTGS